MQICALFERSRTMVRSASKLLFFANSLVLSRFQDGRGVSHSSANIRSEPLVSIRTDSVKVELPNLTGEWLLLRRTSSRTPRRNVERGFDFGTANARRVRKPWH